MKSISLKEPIDYQLVKVKGHPNYMVSTIGEVYSIINKVPHKLKPWYDRCGYLRVRLNGKTMFVHRIVAAAYIPNPDKLPQINHKNNTKDDNNVMNLEWCDSSYNCKRAHEDGLCYNSGKKRVKVIVDGVLYNSCSDAERSLGYAKDIIAQAVRRHQSSVKGLSLVIP